MLRRAIILMLLAIFAFGDVAPSFFVAEAVAQEQQPRKRRTLMDLLFGTPEPPPPVVQAPVVTQPRRQATLPAVPETPKVEKAENATRLAVFGDSMAVDLARALERLYAEDPNLLVVNQGVGSSGFVRDDFFDWNSTIEEQIAEDSFDIAVVIIGINDRQNLQVGSNSLRPLTDEWNAAYRDRVAEFVGAVRNANKPLIWLGLPPMSKSDYSNAIGQISGIQRLAVFGGGAEFVDIYDRFVGEDGRYSSSGPDLNGNLVGMRKDDGIHFSAAGADKVAFYLSQSIKLFYRGGGVSTEVADALAGTDAALMVRPPYQGLGQTRLLEVAGAVIPLSRAPKRATDLVTAASLSAGSDDEAFDMLMMVEAPVGRADAFGVGKLPAAAEESESGTPMAALQ